MLKSKFQSRRSIGSGEEDCLKVFTAYGHRGHLGYLTKTCINFHLHSPIKRPPPLPRNFTCFGSSTVGTINILRSCNTIFPTDQSSSSASFAPSRVIILQKLTLHGLNKYFKRRTGDYVHIPIETSIVTLESLWNRQ